MSNGDHVQDALKAAIKQLRDVLGRAVGDDAFGEITLRISMQRGRAERFYCGFEQARNMREALDIPS